MTRLSTATLLQASTFATSRTNPQPDRIAQAKTSQITLVSYAVTKAAYEKIIPLFGV